MKKYILILIGMLLTGFQAMAWHADATFRSIKGEPMIVILNGKKINTFPSEVVRLTHIASGRHYVKIRMLGSGRKRELKQFINLRGDHQSGFQVRLNYRQGIARLSKVSEVPLNHSSHHTYSYNNSDRGTYSRYNNGHHGDYHFKRHQCLIAEHFNIDAFLHTINRKRFDGDKLIFAKRVIGNKILFAEDVLRIMRKFSLESNRVDFATYAYHRVCDKENYQIIYDALRYNSSIREIERCIYNDPWF